MFPHEWCREEREAGAQLHPAASLDYDTDACRYQFSDLPDYRIAGRRYISNQISMLRSTGESASISRLEFLRSEFALDRPFIERYGIWVGLWPGPNGFDGSFKETGLVL